MEFTFTSLFHRSYNGLSEPQQKQIDEGISRFRDHHRPPFPKGWRVHKLGGIKGTPAQSGESPPNVWEMHAPGPGALLITFQFGEDDIIFRNCGHHDEVLQSP